MIENKGGLAMQEGMRHSWQGTQRTSKTILRNAKAIRGQLTSVTINNAKRDTSPESPPTMVPLGCSLEWYVVIDDQVRNENSHKPGGSNSAIKISVLFRE